MRPLGLANNLEFLPADRTPIRPRQIASPKVITSKWSRCYRS